jgi:hypothetical protein
MKAAHAGMKSDQTKENYPDSQISPLKLENAPSSSRTSTGNNDSESCILHELKGIRSELSESMHKLKVFSATTAAGIPHEDGDSFAKLFCEISELVARMSSTEAKAEAVLEAQMEQFSSQHELRTTVLRGFENDLVIDDADNSLFITRRANLISVIHEHSKKCGVLASDAKAAHFSGDSTSSLLQEALWQKQLAQQQIQISSLQFQLEEQIAHLRMAAGIGFILVSCHYKICA